MLAFIDASGTDLENLKAIKSFDYLHLSVKMFSQVEKVVALQLEAKLKLNCDCVLSQLSDRF